MNFSEWRVEKQCYDTKVSGYLFLTSSTMCVTIQMDVALKERRKINIEERFHHEFTTILMARKTSSSLRYTYISGLFFHRRDCIRLSNSLKVSVRLSNNNAGAMKIQIFVQGGTLTFSAL